MKNSIIKGKSKRTKLFALLTVLAVVLLFTLNLVLMYWGQQKSLYVDLTPEGLYTLTDAMKQECAFIDELDNDERKFKITFCADPDTLIASDVTRIIYFMALQLQSEFDNLEVETVNVVYNPTAVSQYKKTSLSKIEQGDIIISYGDRYRIQKPLNFWYGSDTALSAYDGEYKMATYIMSVTAVNRPAAYFVTGHGETYYDTENPDRAENIEAAALYDMLTECGLDVKTVNLEEAGRVPEDCVLLVINNPREDFKVDPDRLTELDYASEIEILERYLINNSGSIMISRDHKMEKNGVSALPAFDNFLYEWGFDFSESVVYDDENYLDTSSGEHNTIIGEYNTDENSYGYAIYGDFAALPSAASTIFSNAGYIKTSYKENGSEQEPGDLSVERVFLSFMNSYSSAAAFLENENANYSAIENEGALTLAAVTARRAMDSYTGETKYSYVFCVNGTDFFSNELLYNSSYANYEVMSLLVHNMARTDEYASINLGSNSMNSSSYGGKILADITLSATDVYEDVFQHTDTGSYYESVKTVSGLSEGEIAGFAIAIFTIPIIILGLGIAVHIKRRFL